MVWGILSLMSISSCICISTYETHGSSRCHDGRLPLIPLCVYQDLKCIVKIASITEFEKEDREQDGNKDATLDDQEDTKEDRGYTTC